MSQKFIIAIRRPTTTAQRDAITDFLQEKGWKFWHWIEDTWFLSDVDSTHSPRGIWEELRTLPGLEALRGLCIEMGDPPRYWGNNSQESWEWLALNWGIESLADYVAAPPGHDY